MALAMIHALQDRGECKLLAVTITKDHPMCARYVDALDTFYGRPDVPVGIVTDGKTPDPGKFVGLAEERRDGQFVYPHDVGIATPARDAVDLLRETLAEAADGSVVIAQVGFSTNLARLLASKADEHSPLGGTALVAQKVRVLSIMAGAFAPIDGKTHREYNVIMDIPSARTLAESWPTPIVWSGFEIGLAVRYPAVSIDRDFGYRADHIVRESYQRYLPTPHERPTWDLTSALWAIRPDRGYFGLSEPGTVTVADNGETAFQPHADGSHRYLILDPSDIARVRELLAALVSAPPANSN
jgi:inosine-uridine nucleoside N-ribohydrolase